MRWCLAILVLLTSCDQRKPPVPKEDTALAQAFDADIAKTRASNPGIKEACLKKIRAGELGALEWMDNPDCFEMLPGRRWSGLWNSGWEWTSFCPDPAKECPTASESGDIWLEFGKDREPQIPDGLYRIEFQGRRTQMPGHFGHLDQYDHLMVVDRLISIRPVQVPWPAKDKGRK
jgi:hypothetical protein